jgi:hypothetical protein
MFTRLKRLKKENLGRETSWKNAFGNLLDPMGGQPWPCVIYWAQKAAGEMTFEKFGSKMASPVFKCHLTSWQHWPWPLECPFV